MIQVTLPQLSLAMKEGTVTRWLVTSGERVLAGQPIVEIETDKAVVEVEAPAAGTIRLAVDEGAVIDVDGILADIDEAVPTDVPTFAAPTSPTESATGCRPPPAHAAPAALLGRHHSSPAARRLARERGIEIPQGPGSGPAGRVTVKDLASVAGANQPALREAVVAQLTASWRDIPHIHIAGELDGCGLSAAKQAAGPRISITDFLILAVVRALRFAPELNGSRGKLSERVHLAVAVATPTGVIAPVIRNAAELSVEQIARERERLVLAARSGTSVRKDLGGGTFTLSNLGAYPVDFFAPIVSAPQIATLATGRLAARPVADGGMVVIRHRLWANVAIDHRGADGVSGARFLAALQHCLSDLVH